MTTTIVRISAEATKALEEINEKFKKEKGFKLTNPQITSWAIITLNEYYDKRKK